VVHRLRKLARKMAIHHPDSVIFYDNGHLRAQIGGAAEEEGDEDGLKIKLSENFAMDGRVAASCIPRALAAQLTNEIFLNIDRRRGLLAQQMLDGVPAMEKYGGGGGMRKLFYFLFPRT
jgi:hypothetical protein